MTFFGLAAGFSPIIFTLGHAPLFSEVLSRALLVPVWIWLNLLHFCIGNQRNREAAEEDASNKPWRPIPAGRITCGQAGVLVKILYPLVWIISVALGGGMESLSLVVQGIIYNDLGGGDNNPFIRNAINAGGYLSFQLGAVRVATATQGSKSLLPCVMPGILCPAADTTTAAAPGVEFSSQAQIWFLLLALLFFTTVHIQDLPDQDGDSKRGRRTVPLVFGDRPARYSLTVAMTFWSLVTPYFWHMAWTGYIAPLAFGAWVVARTLRPRNEKADRNTFKVWNSWVVMVFTLPLVKSLGLA